MSNSCPMDNNNPDARSLNMCALVAIFGSFGISRLQVCVAVIVPLFDSMTSIPSLVTSTFLIVIALQMYWYVLPSSKTSTAAILATSGFWLSFFATTTILAFTTLIHYFSLSFIVSPMSQFLLRLVAVAIVPTILLLRTALSVCPSHLRWQDALM